MPWLTSNVFKQSADEPLVRLVRHDDGPKSVRFRHIIHAYRDEKIPQNTEVQAITFDSVRLAAQYAAPDYPVTCVGVTYAEDLDLLPPGIIRAAPLTRVVGEVAQFRVPRPLPMLFDILSLGVAAEVPAALTPVREEAPRGWLGRWLRPQALPPATVVPAADPGAVDYVIMTNSDIHLQPAFYRVLGTLIAQGYDVITVNRRTLEVGLEERAFNPLFMADHGRDHGGFDCFVFPRAMMDDFVVSNSCCGAGHVMRSLLFNLVAQARRFLMLTQAHLTYHLGDDAFWHTPALSDYIDFNVAEARRVAATLAGDPEKAKRLADFVTTHESEAYAQAWVA